MVSKPRRGGRADKGLAIEEGKIFMMSFAESFHKLEEQIRVQRLYTHYSHVHLIENGQADLELPENQAIKDEMDERNLLEDMQSEELAMALGLDYGAVIKEEPLSICPKKITSPEELSKIPKDEGEVSSSAGESIINVVKVKEKHKRRSTASKKFNLVFPRKKVYRCLRRLTRLRVADAATVSMIAIVKYLVEEVFCTAYEMMIRHKRKRIIPQHIGMGVHSDEELAALFRDTLIPSAGRFGTFYLTS